MLLCPCWDVIVSLLRCYCVLVVTFCRCVGNFVCHLNSQSSLIHSCWVFDFSSLRMRECPGKGMGSTLSSRLPGLGGNFLRLNSWNLCCRCRISGRNMHRAWCIGWRHSQKKQALEYTETVTWIHTEIPSNSREYDLPSEPSCCPLW